MKTTDVLRSFGVVAVLGATLFSADAAQAIGGFNSLPIGACQKVSSGGVLAYQWDGIFNASSSSDMTIECSLPNTYNMAGGVENADLRWAGANVRLGNSTRPISCRIDVVDGGQIMFTGETKKTTPNNDSIMAWDNLGDVMGAVYFSCTLPRKKEGRSGIRSLWATGF